MARKSLKLGRLIIGEPEPKSVLDPDAVRQFVGETEPIEYSEPNSSDFVAPVAGEPEPEPTDTDASQPRRGRGRPRKSDASTSSRRTREDKETPEGIADVLYSCHYMLAKMCDSELLELDQDEAAKLGEAIARVNKLYSNRALSPKTVAWFKLLTALGTVYGPRAVAYTQNKATAKNKGKITVIDPPERKESKREAATIESV
jgi:hypothetical protein